MRGLRVMGLLGMLLSTWVLPARADERVTAGAYYGGLVLGDLASTKYALDHGALERNYKSHAHAIIGSVAVAGVLTATDVWLGHRDKRAQKILRIGAGLGLGGLMVRNYLNARNGGR